MKTDIKKNVLKYYETGYKKKGANYTTALAFGRVKSKKELIGTYEVFSEKFRELPFANSAQQLHLPKPILCVNIA